MTTAFRGYTSRRAWVRAKWRGLLRFLHRFPGEARRATRHIWWRWAGERDRVIAERDRNKAWAEEQFKRARASDHAVYMLKVEHRGASVDLLRQIADEITCEPGCEIVGPMDWTTGISECPRSDCGECPFEQASQLRDLAAALETYAALKPERTTHG
jgi:hypothetical protein